MEITPVELQKRWVRDLQAWQPFIDKYQVIDLWYNAFKKHMEHGEAWGESYRFPELFGAVQRKYDNLVEYWPEMVPSGKDTIAFQHSYQHVTKVANIQRAKNRSGMDTIKTGVGVIFVAPVRYTRKKKIKDPETGKITEKEIVLYDGLAAERVDPRDFIPCSAALVLHDQTGQEQCPYVWRRRIYYYDSFKKKYASPIFKNLDKVKPTTYSGGFSGQRVSTQNESREKSENDYVTVLEYWDVENDVLQIFANDFQTMIFDSPEGIPYSHKQIPFHAYYNYRQEDSMIGIGEVEINMPYDIFKEEVLNLMIDNAKLELQPAWVVDGEINFNTEETELEPGAVFTVRGLSGGKLSDHMMPFRTSGITSDIPQVINSVEDSRIIVTGDDTRSLYTNPNQLATQTLSKREALQKRIRGNIVRNTVESEFYLASQVASLLKNELSKPYKNEKSVPVFRKISVKGYEAIQDKKEEKVSFEKLYGAESSFYLNPKVAENFDEIEIEIVPTKLDEEIKRDMTEKLMLFMQVVMEAAQTPEGAEILKGMDVSEFLKQISSNLNLDTGKIFPALDVKYEEIDVIDSEHQQVAMGVVPEIKPNEDSMEHYAAHVEFEKTSVFKRLSKKAKEAMNQHKILTLQNAVTQKANLGKPVQPTASPMDQAGTTSAPGTFQGIPKSMAPAAQQGGQPIPTSSFGGRVQQGIR